MKTNPVITIAMVTTVLIFYSDIYSQKTMKSKLTSGNIRIAYTDVGKGDTTLLLMPGWCANRTVFNPLIPLLSKRYRVVSLDWRGHGESEKAPSDFGQNELVEDALVVIAHAKIKKVIPVALAHAGWVAIDLKSRLGSEVLKIVFLEWLVLDPPPPFLVSLKAMQDPDQLKPTLDVVFEKWINHVDNPGLVHFVKDEMGAYGIDMWSRGARAISGAYSQYGNPLKSLDAMKDQPVVLHLYGQPDDPGYLSAQKEYSQAHPWYHLEKLSSKSHFPMFEIPNEMATLILQFARNPSQ